ncbi:MAG: SurA N-terminal domain-containing protein [Desulfuromonadales bacterium]|nr:SurA N-terminal domain-containing protein [Desulfuromonadales bacterium]
MTRFLSLLLPALLLLVSPVAAKTLTKVVAVVNQEIISSYRLDKAVLTALARDAEANQLTSQEFDQLRRQVLEQLINEKLVEQRIKELGLTVPDPELNAAIEDVQRKNNFTAEQLQKAVESQGMSFAAYREQLKNEILRYKLLGREVNYKVQVTSSEVREYFNEHIDEYHAAPKVRVSSISYKFPADADEQEIAEIRKQVQVTRGLLQGGEAVEQVLEFQGAGVFGGDMGELVEEDLTEQLQQALRGLAVGQVSEPVEMNGQIHLFVVTDRKFAEDNLYEQVKDEIERLLEREKTDLRFQEWARELRDRGHIEVRI